MKYPESAICIVKLKLFGALPPSLSKLVSAKHGCVMHREASLMLYRKFQTYTACSVHKCAAKRSNKFSDLKQIVNKKGKRCSPMSRAKVPLFMAEAAQCVLFIVFFFFFSKMSLGAL